MARKAKLKQKVKLTSAFDLFGKSYEVVMRNLKNFAILLALPFLASISSVINYSNQTSNRSKWQGVDFFGGAFPTYAMISVVGLGLFLFMVFVIVALLINAMTMSLELEGAKDKTPSLGHLWQMGKKYWLRLLGLFIMIGLYFVMAAIVGLVIFPVFILLHLFGVGVFLYIVWMVVASVFIVQNYFLSPYVLIDQDKPIFDTLSESSRLSKGNVLSIWSVIGVSILLGLTSALPFIGALVSFTLGALYSVAPALRYLELKKLQ